MTKQKKLFFQFYTFFTENRMQSGLLQCNFHRLRIFNTLCIIFVEKKSFRCANFQLFVIFLAVEINS